MCGIAGVVDFSGVGTRDGQPVFEQLVRDMCDAITHRGPDDGGFYFDSEAGLGMRRLSIIDVAGGHQPVSNEAGTIWVVFNGEIYNFRELRSHLEARGHRFATRTDTETIVHLYEEYGPGCVERLRGMFGFALWDAPKKKLLLARDRLGIKPLYYSVIGSRIVFASELKSIALLPEVSRTLNWGAVAHVLSFLTTSPNESILEGVKKLEPGHLLVASPEKTPSAERYWKLEFNPDRGRTEAFFVERLRELIDESVRLHMVSDVPLGSFLSGGIDSSAVAATAAGCASEPLRTFSIGFREPEYDESSYAQLVAEKIGANHHGSICDSGSLDDIERIAWHLDEPFGDSSAIPTYLVSKLAAEKVKVALSGDGGDELFAGYDKYKVEQKERGLRLTSGPARAMCGQIARRMPRGMRGRNFLLHRSLTGAERYLDACTLFRHDDMASLLEPEFAAKVCAHAPWQAKAARLNSPQRDWLSALQDLDIHNYLPLDILAKVDRMSMAHSLEVRVPLLDHKVVEFAATIPPELNLKNGTTKYVLKQAMRGILPDQVIDRTKKGFAVPLGHWFRGQLGSYVRDLLLSDTARRRGYFRPSAIRNLIARHERGENLDLQLWTLISFELWAKAFLDRSAGGSKRAAA